ncbi:MAG TPA: hypothetical protein PLX89_16830 [Verrucomicrobiota bacterium]|nr:hypothetical protein [Verrucomicrobiota bacterium]
MEATFDREFWQRHPGLVWSNRQADDGVRIRAALSRPRFEQLLDISRYFGLDRVEGEWRYLSGDDSEEVRRATPMVERILHNIALGQSRAAA